MKSALLSIASAQSTRLYRVCIALVVAAMLSLLSAVALPTAMAQETSIRESVGTGSVSRQALVASQAFAARKPINSAAPQPSPAIVDRLRQALGKRVNLPFKALTLVEAMPTSWTDGCLGLAKMDELCTQALIKGWRIVLADRAHQWVYHTDQQGHVYRLE